MRKFTHAIILVVGLLSIIGGTAGSASAFTNSGDTSYTGTSGPVTFSNAGGVTLACTSDTFTGTISGSNVFSLSITYAGCRLSGVAWTVTCSEQLTPTSYDPGTDTITGGLSLLAASGLGCSLRLGSTELCRLNGSLTGTYKNATTTTRGVFNVPASTTLRFTNGTGGTCPFGNNVNATVTAATESITAASGGAWTTHNGPRLT